MATKSPFRSKPYQSKIPENPNVSPEAFEVLKIEANELIKKKAVRIASHMEDEFISTYFAVPKPRSAKFRPILNLKYFNEHIKHYKFKMDSFAQVRDWIQPGAYLIGMDLKDQFLSVPINGKFRKYLRFKWLNQLLEWCVLPFVLKCSPCVVTKHLKPVLSF